MLRFSKALLTIRQITAKTKMLRQPYCFQPWIRANAIGSKELIGALRFAGMSQVRPGDSLRRRGSRLSTARRKRPGSFCCPRVLIMLRCSHTMALRYLGADRARYTNNADC